MGVPVINWMALFGLMGNFVPWDEAKIHVLTHGLHYASSVFEGQRAYCGEVFKLTEHTQRLHLSAETLDFEIPFSIAEIDDACRAVLKKQNLSDAYMRPISWRGSGTIGISAQNNKINLAIAAWDWPSYFDTEQKLQGIRLDISDWRRPDPKTIPCHVKAAGLYMICTISKHAAEAKGYADALMFDYRGLVAEATGANIFFVRNGEIHTPITDCILNGITRKTVIDLARQRGLKVSERTIMPKDMEHYQECFLTGTAVEVTPVSEIGPYKFVPGEVCKILMEDYAAEVRKSPS